MDAARETRTRPAVYNFIRRPTSRLLSLFLPFSLPLLLSFFFFLPSFLSFFFRFPSLDFFCLTNFIHDTVWRKMLVGKKVGGEKPPSFPIWAWGQDRSAIRPDLPPERKRNNRTCAPKRKKNNGGFSPTSICPDLHFSPDSSSQGYMINYVCRSPLSSQKWPSANRSCLVEIKESSIRSMRTQLRLGSNDLIAGSTNDTRSKFPIMHTLKRIRIRN